MRVLFWSEFFWPYIGGAEVFAANLLCALRERGHEVIVVTGQDPPDLPTKALHKKIPVYRFPFLKAFADRSVDQLFVARHGLIKLKRDFAPDLVHIHGFAPSVFFQLETMNVHPSPLLVTLIEERQHDQGRELLGRMLRAADWVTGKAAGVLVEAHKLVPETVPRSSVIHNGLEVPAVLPEPLPINAPRLLCLGRLATQKGFDLALTALALICDRFPQVRLTIAGDGPERDALTRQVSDLGLTNIVDFTGWVSPHNVFALINTASIVVMPSRWEGLPSVALQAGMMARPLIATRISGLLDVVVHQKTGLLVKPENAKSMAEGISWLLDRPEAAAQMGHAGRQRVQAAFSWEQCVSAYDALWRRLSIEWPGQRVAPSIQY